jgi:hypothetical protein
MNNKPLIDYSKHGEVECNEFGSGYKNQAQFNKLLYRSNGIANAIMQAKDDLGKDLDGISFAIIADLIFFGFLRFTVGMYSPALSEEQNTEYKKIMISYLIEKLTNLKEQMDFIEKNKHNDPMTNVTF